MKRLFSIICILLFLSINAHATTDILKIEQQFQNWIASDFWKKAQKSGISNFVYQQALGHITLNWKLPDLVIPGEKPTEIKKQHQAEFGSPANYFNEKSIGFISNTGKARLNDNIKILKKIEAQYGVPASILVAIWGRETAFGTVKIPYNAFDVLATKAFMSTRKDMFEAELIAALKIVQAGYIDVASMKSSWAGALGQPQFMPTSYLKYAVDFDGDKHRNIWTSTADSLASIGNYLQKNGWQKGRDWGYEIKLPANIPCDFEGIDQGKTFLAWQNLGIKRMSDKPFPSQELNQQAYLLMPAGRLGPAFLVTDNFYAIKSYNMSDLYALYIGNVSDRIAQKSTSFQTSWQKIAPLYRSDVAKMQNKLQAQGYDIGKADGLAGFKTRRSIGLWQNKHHLAETCFPSQKLIKDI